MQIVQPAYDLNGLALTVLKSVGKQKSPATSSVKDKGKPDGRI